MARTCSVCTHPDRQNIELEMATGSVSYRDLSEEYSELSASALQRHAANHLGDQEVRTLVVRGEAQDLVAQGITTDKNMLYTLLAENYATARRIQNEALDSDQPSLALKAIKEARDSLALLNKFTGVLEDKQGETEAEMELKALTLALKVIMPRHKEAARDLARELEDHDHFEMGTMIRNFLILRGDIID